MKYEMLIDGEVRVRDLEPEEAFESYERLADAGPLLNRFPGFSFSGTLRPTDIGITIQPQKEER